MGSSFDSEATAQYYSYAFFSLLAEGEWRAGGWLAAGGARDVLGGDSAAGEAARTVFGLQADDRVQGALQAHRRAALAPGPLLRAGEHVPPPADVPPRLPPRPPLFVPRPTRMSRSAAPALDQGSTRTLRN
eukprot:1120103-Prorocentrum_minimum.AAC.1